MYYTNVSGLPLWMRFASSSVLGVTGPEPLGAGAMKRLIYSWYLRRRTMAATSVFLHAAVVCVASPDALTRRAVLALPLVAAPLAAHASGKLVVDESNRFSLKLPAGFVASKRSASQGTLYVAGNFPRAAVVSVTAWPIGELLASDAAALSLPGMPAAKPRSTSMSPSSLSDIAPSEELAKILARQRDREQGGGLSSSVLSSTGDGGRLVLELLTELPVSHRPLLLRNRSLTTHQFFSINSAPA